VILAPEVGIRRGTTTRAVYSLCGSMEGVFSALYSEAYLGLIRQMDSVPLTGEPRRDLIQTGLDGFRMPGSWATTPLSPSSRNSPRCARGSRPWSCGAGGLIRISTPSSCGRTR